MIERPSPLLFFRLCAAALLLLLLASAALCRSAPPGASRPGHGDSPLTPVIIDTDIGSYIDDSFAIGFALQSWSNLNVLMLVTATDDTQMRAKIAAKFLTIAGRDYIPIGLGAPNDNCTNHTLWEWAADFDLSSYRGGVFDFDAALDMMHDIISSSSQVVEIHAMAPMVNFPYLLDKWPDIVNNTRIRAMGGSIYRGYDNSTTPTAEYNVRLCPSCFNLVLKAHWHDPVSLTPLDTSGVASLTPEEVQELLVSTAGLINALDMHTLFWCTKGVILCHLNTSTVALPDTVAVLLALPNATDYVNMYNMNLIATVDGHVKVDDNEGAPTQVALDWKGNLVGLNSFKQHLTNTLLLPTC